MALKVLKPVTASSRHTVLVDKRGVFTKSKPEKSLVTRIKKPAGRSGGKVSMRHKGDLVIKKYRKVDFARRKHDVQATVSSIEYDPNRNTFISLITYIDGEKAYILSPNGIKVGQKVTNGENAPAEVGNALPLSKIPVGSEIHNIEINPGSGGVLVRSAGLAATLLGFDKDYAQVRMPSKEVRLINVNCYATIGALSNPDHKNIKLGKAGRNRWKGVRPTVRGMAQHPASHPHGGGEAKGVIGHIPRDPWGNIRGKNTRRKKNRFSKMRLINRKGRKLLGK